MLRVDGQIVSQSDLPTLDEPTLRRVLAELTDEAQQAAFTQELELDFAYHLPGEARFRINAARQRGGISLTLRVIPLEVPHLSNLNLPGICAQLATRPRGLVLISGPAASGKSTTLAAMIEYVNRTLARRIVTIEDPIEYIFEDRQSLITQREVGEDTHSFAAALKHALRQDPDLIMVGEMRDLETIAATLTAAETGHLGLATLHTPSAPEAVDRIVDVFPAHQQAQIRAQLAMTLTGVITQRLALRADQAGRVPVCEVMVGTPAIANLIREAKTPQMVSVMQTNREQGMQTLNQALVERYRHQTISLDEALRHTNDPEGLRRQLSA